MSYHLNCYILRKFPIKYTLYNTLSKHPTPSTPSSTPYSLPMFFLLSETMNEIN